MNFIHKITVLFFLVVSMNSCKQNSEKKSSDTQTVEQKRSENPEEKAPIHFSLTLSALIQKNDNFQLFYIQENTSSYNVNQFLTREVSGSDQYQDITFDLPTEFYPFNLRLDFGTNPLQNSIQVEKCTLYYGSSDYVIKGSEMKDYFTFNEGVEILSDSTTFSLKTFKQGSIDKYDPFLMGNLKLNDVLLKKL